MGREQGVSGSLKYTGEFCSLFTTYRHIFQKSIQPKLHASFLITGPVNPMSILVFIGHYKEEIFFHCDSQNYFNTLSTFHERINGRAR